MIGEPRSLGGSIASIYAMQVIGPAGEVLYFNSETGDRAKSRLPIPGSQVDRLNIAILGAPDAGQASSFYRKRLGLRGAGSYDLPVSILSEAQGLPADTVYRLEMVSAAEPGNLLEIDAYPASAEARSRAEGELPPGNAMISFIVDSLEPFRALLHAPPGEELSDPYRGRRSAALSGPAGEMVELIESSAQ